MGKENVGKLEWTVTAENVDGMKIERRKKRKERGWGNNKKEKRY